MEFFIPLAEKKLQCSYICIISGCKTSTQIFSDFSVFLHLFTRKSIIALAAYIYYLQVTK
jgi:hypothetical protein